MKLPSHKTYYYLVLAILLGVHLYGVMIFLPLPSQLINNEPIYNSDYPLHFYQAFTFKKYLTGSGRSWGYDPHFMAGYPGNTVYDVGYKLNEVFVFLFSFIGLGRAYKLFVGLTFILYPLMVYLAAKKFQLSYLQCLVAILLSILIWNLDHNFTGISRRLEGFLGWGMFTFSFACYLSVFLISIFYRYSCDGRRLDIVLLFLLGPVLISLHFFSLVIISIPVTVMICYYLPKRGKKYMIIVGIWIIWIFICNSFWLIPLLRFFHYSQRWATGGPSFSRLIRNYVFIRGGLRPLPLLLFFGLLGMSTWNFRQNILKVMYSISIIFFIIISFFGYRIHELLASLEPPRFVPALKCLLIIPAAIGISMALKHIRSRVIPGIILIIILSFLIYAMPSTGRLYSHQPEGIKELILFLKTETDESGRILVQDSDPHHPGRYYGAHTLFLPLYMDREQIGGPHYLVPLKHNFAEFKGDYIFGQPLGNWNQEAIKEYFNLYNIRWIVVWSASARSWLQKMSDYAKEIREIELSKNHKLYIFEVIRKSSFFFAGSGKIKADYDRIEIEEASKGEIILKYHWLESLRTVPKLKMEPVKLLDDPVPFICINNPGFSSIVIHN